MTGRVAGARLRGSFARGRTERTVLSARALYATSHVEGLCEPGNT